MEIDLEKFSDITQALEKFFELGSAKNQPWFGIFGIILLPNMTNSHIWWQSTSIHFPFVPAGHCSKIAWKMPSTMAGWCVWLLTYLTWFFYLPFEIRMRRLMYRTLSLRHIQSIFNILGAERSVPANARISTFPPGNMGPGLSTPWSGASWPLCTYFWKVVCPATSGRWNLVPIKTIAHRNPGLDCDMFVGLKCQYQDNVW